MFAQKYACLKELVIIELQNIDSSIGVYMNRDTEREIKTDISVLCK